MYIIAEYLFIENFLVNYSIFLITKKVTKTDIKKRRILLASAIAGIYPFLLFTNTRVIFTNSIVKILVSILIVKLAYDARTVRLFVKQLVAFYTVSFVFAGASIGLYFLLSNIGEFPQSYGSFSSFPAKYLVSGIFLSGVMIKNIFQYYEEKNLKEREIVQMQLFYKDNKVQVKLLNDSGNSLVEPISKNPVIVVEYSTIAHILPVSFREVFEKKKENDYLVLEKLMREIGEEMDIRLIPYNSIGSVNGILLGFRPDYVELISKSKGEIYKDVIVTIYNGKLSTDEQYMGLLNLENIKKGEKHDSANNSKV
ncbi:MAG: sigma-E processing peptidase SpoIIGA [Tissierellaceae bacterium]|nr:sigma-E processing peptidase SpoIIGA [Tissierellaceae bacterium]